LQACGRERDCIEVYTTVEQTHPVTAIKKQAAELRFIMEAPKLQLRPDEKISLPLLDNLDRYKYDSALHAYIQVTTLSALFISCGDSFLYSWLKYIIKKIATMC